MWKVLLITVNDLRQTLSDRALLLLMFVAPLAVATIISVSFGSMADEASPITDIPVAIANLDRGSPVADFDEQYVSILRAVPVPPHAGVAEVRDLLGGGAARDGGASTDGSAAEAVPAADIAALIHAVVTTDQESAREWLVDGLVSVVVVLPADLSRRLTGPADRGPAQVVVMTRPDRTISAEIVENVTRTLLDGFSAGMAITQSVVSAVAATEGVAAPSVLARPGVRSIMNPDQEPPGEIVRLEVSARRSGGIGFNPLVAFGATQAIFFALFTANANAASIMEEERDGTFVRLLASPVRKLTLLGGKLVSTVVMVMVQLLLLFIAFTLIGSLLEGHLIFIWGTQIGRIALVIFLTSFAAAGIGAIIASSAKTPEQSGVIGTVVNMFMAVTGGAFGIRFDSNIRYASAVYWGSNAFEELAGGGSDILLNAMVLGGFGAGAFLLALGLLHYRFTR